MSTMNEHPDRITSFDTSAGAAMRHAFQRVQDGPPVHQDRDAAAMRLVRDALHDALIGPLEHMNEARTVDAFTGARCALSTRLDAIEVWAKTLRDALALIDAGDVRWHIARMNAGAVQVPARDLRAGDCLLADGLPTSSGAGGQTARFVAHIAHVDSPSGLDVHVEASDGTETLYKADQLVSVLR